jgi:hypothetical protein
MPRDVTLGELTLTGAYKFTKMLVGRAEVRQDWADKKVFAVGNSGRAGKAQTTWPCNGSTASKARPEHLIDFW